MSEVKAYPGDARLVYHPYPSSEQGWWVAQGLEAAGEQGRFWEVQDQLLNTDFADMAQTDVEASLMAAAKNAGLNMAEFEEAMNSPETKTLVESARQQAVSLGVNHPAIYVNGKEWALGAGEDLQATVENAMKGLGQ